MAQRIDVQYVQFYMHGSAAERVTSAIPVHTGALPQAKKRKIRRICVDPVATLGIVVAVCMLIMMAAGVSQLRKELHKTAVMEQYVELLQQENKELQARYAAECDMEAVEKTALALGMVPKENIAQIPIQVELPQHQEPERISIWEQIGTILTGLFA